MAILNIILNNTSNTTRIPLRITIHIRGSSHSITST